MSQQLASPRTRTTTRGTGRLLLGGVVAGPLFLAVWWVQALTRDGFDPTTHPLSLLSLGGPGWIQITNFVVTGALYVACAVGMRRVLHPGRGGTWGPGLVGALGVGLVVSGVFVTDAGAGFPEGGPAGAPVLSWHGALHGVGFALAFGATTVGALVFARRFAALGRWGWVGVCVATVVAALAAGAWPDPDSLSVRLVIATAIQFGFVAAVAAHLLGGRRRT